MAREYLPVIRQFSDIEVQKSLLRESAVTLVRTKDPSREAPGAPVQDRLPSELRFLEGGLTDLGFAKLNLPPGELDKLYRAFCENGVAIPGTPYKLRHSVMSLFTFVETAGGGEVMLPADWRQVVRSQAWIGKKVVPPDLDLAAYRDAGDGYALEEQGDDQLPPGFEPAKDSAYKDLGDGHVKI